ncbi:hypothetical protein [Murinocardiopsis flavida]|nr:hypothetical protein [Murinocardiopsis flavida]
MGVVALTATMSLAVAATAYAGTDERIDVAGGEVSFTHQGDYINSYDLKADGYCLMAELKIINQDHSWTTTSCGYNQRTHKSLKRINEGAPVYLRACYTKKSGNRVKCTGWQGAHA